MTESTTRFDEPTRKFLDLLRQAVEIETPSRSEERFGPLADLFTVELESRGAICERIPAPELGQHVLATFGADDSDTKPLLVLGHMDTVHPAGTLAKIPFTVAEGRVRGPGVYDMKGGIVTLLLALDRMRAEHGELAGPVRVLLTCDEEIGSNSSRPFIEELARSSRAALILEPCVPDGAAKTQRKGMGGFHPTIRGKAAHAGIEPELGASAIHELVRYIERVLRLEDRESGTTLNAGVIGGGSKINVVADEAWAKIDMRFWTRAEADRVEAGVRALELSDPGCTLELRGGVNRYALEKTPESEALFARAVAAAAEVGIELKEDRSGGASDGNLTSAVGCPTLDGLGPDGGGAHSLDEHLLVEDIPRRIALISRLLQRV